MKYWYKLWVKCKITAVVILLILLPERVCGINVQYKDYLPTSDVKCLTIDKATRLWVGVSNGFYILNNSFQSFFSSLDKSSESPLIDVSLIEPYGGKALISASDKLFLFDISLETFREVKLDGNCLAPDAACHAGDYIYLYYSSGNILARFSTVSEQLERVQQFNEYDHYRFEKIVSVSSNPNLLILADNEKGLFELNLQNNRLKKIEVVSQEIKASTLCSYNDILYVATLDDGLFCMSVPDSYKLTGRFYCDGTENGLEDNNILACCIDSTKYRIYISVEGVGVYIYELSDGTCYKLLQSQDLLSVSQICNVGYDHIICVTSGNGISSVKSSFYKTFTRNSKETNTSLSHSSVLSILPDKSDGGIWLGTDGGGINKLFLYSDYDRNRVDGYPSTLPEKVACMTEYDENCLLCLLKRKGLYLFNKKTGGLKPLSLPFLNDNSVRMQSYRNLMISQCGSANIFIFNVGHENYFYEPKSGHYESFDILPDGSTDYVVKSYSNQYHTLIQTNYSIFEINNRTLRVRRLYNSNDYIGASAPCPDGSIFFAVKNVIFRFNPNKSEIKEVFVVPDENIFISSLCRDENGLLWMTFSDNDVAYYEIDNDRLVSYSFSNFADNCYTNNFANLIDGRIFISGAAGMLMLEPGIHDAFDRENQISLEFRSMYVNGVPVSDLVDRIVIPDGNSNVTFSFDVSNGDPLRSDMLKYSLVSNRKGLVYEFVDNEPSVTFYHLMPGNYKLEVSAKGSTGWQSTGVLFKFKVNRPFMSSIYAFFLYFLLVSGLVVLLYMLSQRRKEEKIAQVRLMFTQEKKDNKIEQIARTVHDLRSPLFIVMNRINTALDALADKKSDHDKLSAALPQIDKMTEMINTVLSQVKEENSDYQLFLQSININDWVTQMLSNFQDRAESCGLCLKFVADLSLKRIDSDKRLLESCLRNLLTNAIKYSDSGTIVVRTLRNNGKCRFSVEDQGRGFTCSPDELFKKFFRESKEAGKASGFGIGLSSVKDFAEKLGGSAGAEHNPSGVGSTFWFEVPLFDENEVHNSSVLSNFDTTSYSILVVDDNKDVTDFFKTEFRYLFKKILSAQSVASALEIIRNSQPDFVISDVLFPDMSGVEMCIQIKTNLVMSHIPVALFSSNSEAMSDMANEPKTGPDLIFSMPFDSKMIFQSVKEMLIERVNLQNRYLNGNLRQLSADCTLSIADERFVTEFNTFCAQNPDNALKNISAFAASLGVTQELVDMKFKRLTGMVASEFLKANARK